MQILVAFQEKSTVYSKLYLTQSRLEMYAVLLEVC